MQRFPHTLTRSTLAATLFGCASGAAPPPAAPVAAAAAESTWRPATPRVRAPGVPGSVTIFAPGPTGNVRPIRTIAGRRTGLTLPYGVALDADGELYVTHCLRNQFSVKVYASGASGNVLPLRSIRGRDSKLELPSALAFDSSGALYVLNTDPWGPANTVTVFAPGAGRDAVPIRTMTARGYSRTFGLAVDRRASVYVANGLAKGRDRITVFAVGASGLVDRIRTIEGPDTGLNMSLGLATDSSGALYVANWADDAVRVYAPGAGGDVGPIRTIQGSRTELSHPGALALDSDGTLYVVNAGRTEVPGLTVYAPGADGNVAPIRRIAGDSTGLVSPGGVALDPKGNVYVANRGNPPGVSCGVWGM